MRLARWFSFAAVPATVLCLLALLSVSDVRSVFVPRTQAIGVNVKLGTFVQLNCICGDGSIYPPPPGTTVSVQGINCPSTHCSCLNTDRVEETCDDGNKTSGDGCSAGCQVEQGWKCDAVNGKNHDKFGWMVSKCYKCGNGKVEGSETCDDSNLTSGDGCSSDCKVESGFTCTGSKCQQCGNAKLEGDEKCDDGNTVGGDGCTADCTVESGFKCLGSPSQCKNCGDGLVQGGEKCDDGNNQSWDGCSKLCAIESGWTCTAEEGEESQCSKLCGNGVRNTGELCDLGLDNGIGNGCLSTCKVESGWSCTGTSTTTCTNKKTKEKTTPVLAIVSSSSSRSSKQSSSMRSSSTSSKSSSSSPTIACGDSPIFGPPYTLKPSCDFISRPSLTVPGVTCYYCHTAIPYR